MTVNLFKQAEQVQQDYLAGKYMTKNDYRCKLTEEVVLKGRIKYLKGEGSVREIAKELGVEGNEQALRMAIRGLTWKHLPGGLQEPRKEKHKREIKRRFPDGLGDFVG